MALTGDAYNGCLLRYDAHHAKQESHNDVQNAMRVQIEAAVNVDVPDKGKQKQQSVSKTRKAPNAPKRFKSSYICFFTAKQPEIKKELGSDATVTSVSRRSAELWKNLSPYERLYWEELAEQDKERFMREKALYKGPWQVSRKRTRKDPTAPKRPMSAFLYFSHRKRHEIKRNHPEWTNIQISRILGEMWRNLSAEERLPHIQFEESERKKYKVALEEWRAETQNDEKKSRDYVQCSCNNLGDEVMFLPTSSESMMPMAVLPLEKSKPFHPVILPRETPMSSAPTGNTPQSLPNKTSNALLPFEFRDFLYSHPQYHFSLVPGGLEAHKFELVTDSKIFSEVHDCPNRFSPIQSQEVWYSTSRTTEQYNS